MTVVARRIRATPVRSSTDAWALISQLIAAADGSLRHDLDKAGNIAAMLIAEEHTKVNPILLTGCGPQVRIYTLHGVDAIDGSNINEQALQITPTDGWELSLPAAYDDLKTAAAVVANIDHITVYDPNSTAANSTATKDDAPTGRVTVDLTALED